MMAPGPDSPSLPALLRAARRTYGDAVRAALAENDFEDVPANGSYLLSGIARDGVPLSSLIDQLGVSKQTAGQLVDSLVKRGYLERSVDPADRRRLVVGLTGQGADAASVIRSAVDNVDAALAERVGAGRLQDVRTTLRALADLGDDDAERHSRAPGSVSTANAAAVLYVKELEPMRAFYERCFGMSGPEAAGGDYCVLTGGGWELSLVAVPEALSATLRLSDPPRRRESTPIKLAFEVADIAALRAVVAEAGGRVDPAASAWEFRGLVHVDGTDPEGNVVQLREAVPGTADAPRTPQEHDAR